MIAQQGQAARLQIGALAVEVGLNPKTIRYYEEIGLLPAPRRTAAGYRLYDAMTGDQLRFIVKAKRVGLSLAEIGEILALWRGNSAPCMHLAAMIDRKVAALDEQLQVLGASRRELAALREEADHGLDGAAAICRAIEQHGSRAHPVDGGRA